MSERDIFTAARAMTDPAARAAYLDGACGDAALRRRVDRLLRADGGRDSLLDEPAVSPSDTAQSETCAWTPTGEADVPAEKDSGAPFPFLAPPGQPGSLGRIGHYEVLEVLGRGGFGIVFRAFDETLQRVVAVKVLAPAAAVASSARKRFLREARSSSAVRHKNVVQVHAVGEQPLPHLVMEFIPGETLQERINRVGALEAPEVLHIGWQIAAGLAAAHATGLIHRDVKPANVLIERGSNGAVKLTDFGLARAADDARLTQSGIVAGTPLYMSPEQARGEPLDHRSDLFSLGSVLYAMCAGRPPFQAATSLGVLSRVCDDAPRPIGEIHAGVPDALTAVIGRLLAKDPDARFQTATEIADLLRELLARLPEPSLPPPPIDVGVETVTDRRPVGKGPDGQAGARAPSGARWARRRWLAAGAIVAALVACLLALLGLLRPPTDRNPTGPPATTLGAAELKEVVTGHQQAAMRLLQANQPDEALARLGRALADIDRADVDEAQRHALRLDVYRQRSQTLLRLGRAEEADRDGKLIRTLLEEVHAEQPDNLEVADSLAELLLAEPAAPWTVLRPPATKSANGATLTPQPDGSILVSGPNVGADVYTLSLDGLPSSVAVLRLEVLSHPSLPSKGPGRHQTGNFQLGEITLYKMPAGADSGATGLPIAQAATDYAWPGMLIERAFDGDPLTPWHVWGRLGQDHWALFQLRQAVPFAAGDRLVVRLEHCPREPLTNLGCFRLSVSGDAQALATDPLQAALRQARPRGFAAVGAAWFVHGDFARAVGPLTRAVEAGPDSAATDLMLALAHQELGQPEKARQFYDRAMKGLNPFPPDGMIRLLVRRALVRIEGLSAAEAEARLTAMADDGDLAAVTAAVEKSADKRTAYLFRATWYACRGRWRECAKDHLARTELNPKDRSAWTAAAASLLLGGDVDEYRRLCGRMAEQFHGAQNPEEAESVIKVCLLRPGTIDAASLPVETIEKSLDEGRAVEGEIPWLSACRGLAAYRDGDYQQAERRSDRALETSQTLACSAEALLVRALAEHQLHRPDEAQRSYAAAAALVPGELRMLGSDEYEGKLPINAYSVPADLLIAEVLRREAEGVLFPDLPAFLKGERQPRDNAERLALAVACATRGRPEAAARLYADAFAADPERADAWQLGRRYAAACCAVRAGVAVNAAHPEEQEQSRLRRQALHWLQENLTARTRQWENGTPQDRSDVREAMRHWESDPELTGVRAPEALALLPADERREWTELWAAVGALLARGQEEK